MTDTPDLQSLLAQRAEIDLAIARAMVAPLTESKGVLASAAAVDLVDQARALIPQLPGGTARDQLGNVVNVLVNVPQVIDAELTRVSQLVANADAPDLTQPE